MKNERVHATRYRTHQDAKADLFEYIEVFYNRTRRHSSLGFVSPERYLQDWINAQQTRMRLHNSGPLEGEKPREAHVEICEHGGHES
ncbi:hypothetical protein BVI2075_420033 [Burkholderia vietnamiensis]|nr:hypothetical protein BVI2075_420033 [Burkholderia vietnamiensis]CAG9226829.1 hypothetical protein BVI1335_600066 [Burkholderia vietnamiensis]